MKSWRQSLEALFAFGLFFVLFATGCSQVEITSEPSGGRVLWSPSGLEPFHSWPPNSWEISNKSENGQTPFKATGVYGDTIFVTVEKEGYRRPLPRPVQLYALRHEELRFELEELPETRRQRLQAEGYILYRGEWVKPEEEGLEQYAGQWLPAREAERLRMKARGLVEYEGEWLEPEKAERRRAEEMKAEGYVEFKGRWVKPERAKRERAIDETVASISAEVTYPNLPSPRVVSDTGYSDAQLELLNNSTQTVQFLFSGPQSRAFELEARSSRGLRRGKPLVILPGRYEVAIIPLENGERQMEDALWASWPLSAGIAYEFKYEGGIRDPSEVPEDRVLPERELHYEPDGAEVPEESIAPKPEPE